jgi:hypothetical protein
VCGLHRSDVAAWTRADTDLVEVADPFMTDTDRAIAGHVVDRIPDRARALIAVAAPQRRDWLEREAACVSVV